MSGRQRTISHSRPVHPGQPVQPVHLVHPGHPVDQAQPEPPQILTLEELAEQQHMIKLTQQVFDKSFQESRTNTHAQRFAAEAKRNQDAVIHTTAMRVANYIDRLRMDLKVWEENYGKHNESACGQMPCKLIRELIKLRATLRVEDAVPNKSSSRLSSRAAAPKGATSGSAVPEWAHYICVSLLKQFYNSVGEARELCLESITDGDFPGFILEALQGVPGLAIYCKEQNIRQGELEAGRKLRKLLESEFDYMTYE